MANTRSTPDNTPPVAAVEYGAALPDKAEATRAAPVVDVRRPTTGCSGEGPPEDASRGEIVRHASARDIKRLAVKLDVKEESLRRLGVGVAKLGWTFPMVSPAGGAIGYRLRYFGGGKATLRGGRLGLFIPSGVDPVAIDTVVEGESDLAAALDIGLRAIGRPGATACIQETVEYLLAQRFNGITIIADCDPNGTGLKGAEKLAALLLAAGHLVRIVLPPEGVKDLREWNQRDGLTFAGFHKHASKFHWQAPDGTPPGFFALGNWQIRSGLIEQVGCTAFAALTAIASYWGRDGLCRIGREEIGKRIGRKLRTVDRAIDQLKRAGVLEIVHRGNKGRWSIYRVHLQPFNWVGRNRPGRTT